MKYKFKSTGNKKIDRIIKQFDEQIKEEYKYTKGDKERCPSYWQKLVFLKTMNWDLNDWREIRGGNFWTVRDSLHGIEQSKFIYKTAAKSI